MSATEPVSSRILDAVNRLDRIAYLLAVACDTRAIPVILESRRDCNVWPAPDP